jgi:hypothetical protein
MRKNIHRRERRERREGCYKSKAILGLFLPSAAILKNLAMSFPIPGRGKLSFEFKFSAFSALSAVNPFLVLGGILAAS